MGRGSAIAGSIALVPPLLVSAAHLPPSPIAAPLLALVTAVAALTAVLLGGARLYLPGEAGRTWWGVWLAMGASAWLVLAWAPEAFPLAFLVITATLHLLANLATDARVRREPHLPPGQRRRQRALVWALPVVGVLVVSAWYRADDDPWDDDGFQTHDDT